MWLSAIDTVVTDYLRSLDDVSNHYEQNLDAIEDHLDKVDTILSIIETRVSNENNLLNSNINTDKEKKEQKEEKARTSSSKNKGKVEKKTASAAKVTVASTTDDKKENEPSSTTSNPLTEIEERTKSGDFGNQLAVPDINDGLAKYRKLLSLGIPPMHLRLKMQSEGVDEESIRRVLG